MCLNVFIRAWIFKASKNLGLKVYLMLHLQFLIPRKIILTQMTCMSLMNKSKTYDMQNFNKQVRKQIKCNILLRFQMHYENIV